MRPIRRNIEYPRITKFIDRDTFERIIAIFYLIKINIRAGLRAKLRDETTKIQNDANIDT